MPLTDQAKRALTEQLAILLEMGEPESIVGTLKRVAERMAHSVTRGAIPEAEAERWQKLAEACAAIDAELGKPEERKAEQADADPSAAA